METLYGVYCFHMVVSRTEALVRIVNDCDIQHRKGWRPSEHPRALDVIPGLRKEVDELEEALLAREAWSLLPDLDGDASAKEELADVLVCVYQIGHRLQITFAELEAEAVRKIKLRFPGAEEYGDA